MTLINIEYGSLASSETLNKNFSYLDDKIAETSSSLATSISSILSNIATINARLSDLSESVENYVDDFNTIVDDCKRKTKILVNKSAIVPNWSGCYGIGINSNFTAPKNGYILILPYPNSSGSLYVNNNVTVWIKQRNNNDDNASGLISIPIKQGDVVRTDVLVSAAYFLPASEVTVENF